ncbi:nuclear transport factor 2 family protein [Pelomonas sp. KK5]|uniref:nuclear transport factor 2 family protein n=1 Tax=Pelomonas sp. KK5 TaxID=1855730 RepID=UPI00097C65B5|nr:nuclear transport factor 2 family protein [Pelomonas sp. KK5]
MSTPSSLAGSAADTLIGLEKQFWQSMVDEDTDTALGLLDEPALMISAHGSMRFDHAQYRQMAEHGKFVLKDYELSDMEVVFPTEGTAVMSYKVRQVMAPRESRTVAERMEQHMSDASVWTRKDGRWRCVMHTETPAEAAH